MTNKTRKVILTGVRELDERLGGGIPLGSLGLVEGQPDSGKSVLCQQLSYGGLHCSETSVAYYTTENSVKSLITQMDSLSLYTLDFFLTDRFRIYPLSVPSYFKDAKKRFHYITEHFSNLPKDFGLVIVDSITLLVAHSNPVATIDFFWACKRACDEGRTVLLVAHSYSFEDQILSRVRSICDAHLRLRLEQVGDRMVKIMEVLKIRGADRSTGEVVSFDIEPKSGISIIPLAKARV